jgi:mycothiol synthase
LTFNTQNDTLLAIKLEMKLMLVRDHIRNYRREDLPGIVDTISAADRAVNDDPRITVEIMQSMIESPGNDPSKDNFIVERDGRVIGYADCEFSESGRCFADCAVHPDYWNQGIGAELVRRTEARIFEWATEKLPADQPIHVYRMIKDAEGSGKPLLEKSGYTHMRSSYQMRIEFDHAIEAVPFPDGIVLRPFDRERDAQAVYEVNEETFADHWGHDRVTYDEWSHFVLNYPGAGADLGLWQIAWDGDQIAGICLNRPYEEADQNMGWTGSLGVRRPWRKQGLGQALLTHSFALFQERGYVRAGLGVDASSLTNAVALYERVGMHVHARYLLHRKMLRGDAPEEV